MFCSKMLRTFYFGLTSLINFLAYVSAPAPDDVTATVSLAF